MRYTVLVAAALAGLASTAPVFSVQAQAPVIQVTEAWARATTSMARVGGVFLTMTATGAADRVVSASSPVAERIELHETIRDGDVMKMREVPHPAIQPGQPTVLRPGGLHIMLIGLKTPLNRGDSFPLTITFEKAPPVTATVTVQAAGAARPGHHH